MTQLSRANLNEGACYALAHSAHLLEDAAILYERNRVSSSFHIAVMAREELGRFNLLCKLAQELAEGETRDAKEVTTCLKPGKRPHQAKLQAGQSTFFITAPLPTESFLVRQKRYEEMRKVDSTFLHSRRLAAQYVDLNPDGTWSKPSDTKKEDAEMLIYTVAGEISDSLMWAENDEGFTAICANAEFSLPRSDDIRSRILSGLRSDGA